MAGSVLFIFFVCFFFVRSGAQAQGRICDGNSDSETCFTVDVKSFDCFDLKRNSLKLAEKDDIVNLHNQIRNNFLTGAYVNLPKAFYMKKVSWNEDLAKMAQKWAEQCNPGKDPQRYMSGQLLGQNVEMHGKESEDVTVDILMQRWAGGVDFVTPDIISEYREPKPEEYDFSPFIQIIWWNTSQVGCGRSTYKLKDCPDDVDPKNCTKDKHVEEVVCNYFPTGNVVGQPVYSAHADNNLLCLLEDKVFCKVINESDFPKAAPEKPAGNGQSRDYRIRSRMTELWPASSTHRIVPQISHFSVLFVVTIFTAVFLF